MIPQDIRRNREYGKPRKHTIRVIRTTVPVAGTREIGTIPVRGDRFSERSGVRATLGVVLGPATHRGPNEVWEDGAMVDGDAVERFLSAPMWAGVDRESRRAVFEAMEEDRASSGATLLVQGQPNDHLLFLIEGSAVIERVYPEGRKETLATLTAPAAFGTTSFFRPDPPQVSVRATSDVRLLMLSHPQHDRLRHANPRAAEALALGILRVLSERFDMLDQRVSDFLAEHGDEPPKLNEWAGFRARLFEEHL
jgi:CRP/FNR family transcriptional regulator, cyclic AMP receptor protein